MLIEVKTKVKREIDAKPKVKTETDLLEKDFFAEAEYKVTELLMGQEPPAKEYEIQSLRQSPIKEIATQWEGEHSYIATLKDLWTDDKGNEKYLRYKVLLWADNLNEALIRTRELAKQGYDMLVEGLREVDYEYITE